MSWLLLDDGDTVVEVFDPPVGRTFKLSELRQQLQQYLALGVKTAPDEETLRVYNEMKGLENYERAYREIGALLAEIEAAINEA